MSYFSKMELSNIIKIVEANINASQLDQEIETDKIDFKRSWYNLTDKKEINEFIKDTSSIANTVGLDGFLIIGFDPKNKEFYDSKFTNSGLRDVTEIAGLIVKHVEYAFDVNIFDVNIDDHFISVLHIPPSLDKPHVIKNHFTYNKDVPQQNPHRIFVRKNTRTREASKSDIELMIYDRKNIIPEYKLLSSMNFGSFRLPYDRYFVNQEATYEISVVPTITFENIGRRPVAITKIEFEIELYLEDVYSLIASKYEQPLIIHPLEIVTKQITFKSAKLQGVSEYEMSDVTLNLNKTVSRTPPKTMIVTLNTGSKFSVQIF